MPKCKNCGNLFPPSITINGRRWILNHRKYCLECSPYGLHNTKTLGENKKEDKRYNPNNDKYECTYCNKGFKNQGGLGMHENACLLNPQRIEYKNGFDEYNRKVSEGTIQRWDKGLTKENSEIIRLRAEKVKEIMSDEEYKIKNKRNPSQETKDKLSKARTKYLMEHPDQVPYRIYHSSKKSYPEEVFEKCLINNNIQGWIYNYPVALYNLDFAFPKLKIDVEIDGSTHNQEKVKKKDEIRNKYLQKNGWLVLRFTAKEIKDNAIGCLNNIKKYLI